MKRTDSSYKLLAGIAVVLFLGAAFGDALHLGTAGLLPLGLAALAGAVLIRER